MSLKDVVTSRPSKGKPSTTQIRKVLVLGSGGLRIGQAGEFDYSGSQAIKALKEEGIETVLVNPNIATVQTDADMADKVYFQPLDVATVTKVIAQEAPDGILLNVGGQTALNLGLELDQTGVLKRYKVAVLGSPVSSIRIGEDRELFKRALAEIGVKTAVSAAVTSPEEAARAAREIGYPIMMRSGFSLGGQGSGKINDEASLRAKVSEVMSAVPQILIEEYLEGWKEIEYEIVRDRADNAITVCNMENLDPMGVHTGESIVVAPSQTLSNQEYHYLREIAIKTARHLGIIGECNIQYAFNPQNGDYRVIELNPRLSRSSALASKATGYPLAAVATKLALGKRLDEIKNAVTKQTSAFFEPALDYLVVKIPRWDNAKFKLADRVIGSEMKSVGEVMAIGRSFAECLQKAVRMLNIGAGGVTDHPFHFDDLEEEISHPTDRRLFALYEFLRRGGGVARAEQLTRIDRWFLCHLAQIARFEHRLSTQPLSKKLLVEAKRAGFSDKSIANLAKPASLTETSVRRRRIRLGITPVIKQIDTLAGEFSAETNYLYTTYHGQHHDIAPSGKHPMMILGSGPYAIGSSVEFDWCAVNAAKTLRQHSRETVMINSNPETVSTDFDQSDRFYFEELSFERIQDIADFEVPEGIVVSMGGQISNNLAVPLARAGYPILGTSATSIDRAENRQKFSSLLNRLGVDQPAWQEVTTSAKARAFATRVGYPILVRPSYVLSGAAMHVVGTEQELKAYLDDTAVINPEYPVVMSQFISNAKELEIDGVAQNGQIVIEAISEHIENAGVHSGDAAIMLPPQRLYLETIRRTKRIAREVVNALEITGPFNIQFIAKDNKIKVIECNVRASRSFPFVSKTTNHNFAAIATEALIGITQMLTYETLELDYVGVKSPQFSYSRLKGADPVAGVEMASTGEVACLGDNLLEAFYASWMASERGVAGKRILLTISDWTRQKLLDGARALSEHGWEMYATVGTAQFLSEHGIQASRLHKISARTAPNVETAIKQGAVDLIINIPSGASRTQQSDGYKIRRLAIDHHIPLITNLQIAQLLIRCLTELDPAARPIKPWQYYIRRTNPITER